MTSLMKKEFYEHEMLHGTLFVSINHLNQITLHFSSSMYQKTWSKTNIVKYIWNKNYFLFMQRNGFWNRFSPSVLMKEDELGFFLSDGYFLKNNPNKEREDILSYFLLGENFLDIREYHGYEFMYNDDFVLFGEEGYRRVIQVKNDRFLEKEFCFSKVNASLLRVWDGCLKCEPVEDDIHLVRAELLGRNIFKII